MDITFTDALSISIDLVKQPDFSKNALKYFLMGKGITKIDGKEIDDEALDTLTISVKTSNFSFTEIEEMYDICYKVQQLIGENHKSSKTVMSLMGALFYLKRGIPIELKNEKYT